MNEFSKIRMLGEATMAGYLASGTDLVLSGGLINSKREIFNPRLILDTSHPVGVVFSTEMSGTRSQLNVGSGFLENDL